MPETSFKPTFSLRPQFLQIGDRIWVFECSPEIARRHKDGEINFSEYKKLGSSWVGSITNIFVGDDFMGWLAFESEDGLVEKNIKLDGLSDRMDLVWGKFRD